MAIFKCKMCGGSLEIQDASVATCEYCGTQQTLPRLEDERRMNLYDRANHFRRNNEFDKAMNIYEQILNEDNTDAEAYWSLVLCRYGIEYVEDPASRKRVPTVNRAQFTSVFDDDNYKSALQYADLAQRSLYESEAQAINEIQKGILAISQKEEPFDVFICYKESDANGRRTPDSVLANDLYHQLTQEGFKVFFSRITLEDKLGSAYEPYIFAALNSAKVMVVLGTKPEYFKAVWVRNEWSRYLALIKQGQKKVLIPAYRDMDPYDLPEEFSHLQAQDMSKLGFMQDLIRGIEKLVQIQKQKPAAGVQTAAAEPVLHVAPLLERAFMFLEDGDWSSADEYCEKVLDMEPKNAQAYLGKLLAELQVKNQEALKNRATPFDSMNNYQKAIRFADEDLKATLSGYITHINTRNAEAVYRRAKDVMNVADGEDSYKEAARLFKSIMEYFDAAAMAEACDAKAEECRIKAEEARKDAILKSASRAVPSTIESCEKAIEILQGISGWKDADKLILARQKKIEDIRVAEEEKRQEEARIAKQTKKNAIIGSAIVCAIIVFVIVMSTVIIPNSRYNKAVALMEEGNYEEAIVLFEKLGTHKDSVERIAVCREKITENDYNAAVALLEEGKYTEAIAAFEALGDYKDSAEKVKDAYLAQGKENLKNPKVGDYVVFGAYEQDNNTANGREEVEWLVLEVKYGKALVISKYALDCQPYHTSDTDVTWETCSLRTWLNNDFINSAFSAEEKTMIPTVTVTADKNPSYDTDPGNATQDQVFLLSITEVNQYFSSNSARACEPTDYVATGCAYVNSDNGNCWWWLRSPGYYQNSAAGVYDGGGIYKLGNGVDYSNHTVRPALWIDLNA